MKNDTRPPASGLLPLVAVLAMAFAYAMAYIVLSDPEMASKFENGSVTPGTDIGRSQAAEVLSILAAITSLMAVVRANVVRSTAATKLVAVAVVLALIPFALVSFFTLQLAF